MSADREAVKAELADRIVAGIVRSDFVVDVTKLDQDDVRTVLFQWSADATFDAKDRLNRRAIELAAAWLESDPRGSLMLDDELERKEELQRDLAELNEREATGEAA